MIEIIQVSHNVFYDAYQNYGNADSAYAHIDGGPDNPRYFTNIADKPTEP